MVHELPGRERFKEAYQAHGQAPWDIGQPQKAFAQVADRLHGSILDAGCGTGANALFFAERGHVVYGIDYLEAPIARAKQDAAAQNSSATFLVMNALDLAEIPQQFDNVIDCGLYHVFSDEDRARYVAAVSSVVKPGGKLWMLCFSDKEPGEFGPRRVTQQEIRDCFADGWEIESISESRFEVLPDLPDDIQFSEGGPYAWLTVAVRRA